MKKFNKVFMYLMAGSAISFTACNDEEVDPIIEPVEEATPVDTAGFESLPFPGDADVYFGQDATGENLGEGPWGGTNYGYSYESGKAQFGLIYNDEYNSWSGVAYSKQIDNTQTGTDGQFVAMPGQGAEGSEVYGIMNGSDTINFTYEGQAVPQSIRITNNAYAYHSMKDGDQFAKKFGGEDGNDPDYFRLTITGLNENNMPTTSAIVFYLADYRFADNSKDYIVNSWETINLSSLGEVSKLAFSFESSDTGDFGINTPKYFAFDNLITQPEEIVK